MGGWTRRPLGADAEHGPQPRDLLPETLGAACQAEEFTPQSAGHGQGLTVSPWPPGSSHVAPLWPLKQPLHQVLSLLPLTSSTPSSLPMASAQPGSLADPCLPIPSRTFSRVGDQSGLCLLSPAPLSPAAASAGLFHHLENCGHQLPLVPAMCLLGAPSP